MAKKYYYAVRVGRKVGVFATWDECKTQVSGYGGAIYKKFESEAEALDFINGSEKLEGKENKEKSVDLILNENEAIVYVDGSFRIADFAYSFGCVFVDAKGNIEEHFQMFERNEDSDMRNVAGELQGAQFAMKHALEKGISKIYLHYDYEGIRSWALGFWKTNKPGTMRYKAFYDEVSKNITVEFIKVQAHSGVELNEKVDKLAKKALGI